MKVEAFKIRDKVTGLFSTGGVSPQWTKVGKTWSTEGYLKLHLTTWISELGYKKIPDSWEVVKLSLHHGENTFSARDLADRPAKR